MALAASKNIKIDYLISDLNDFIFPKKFDAVISIWAHMPELLRKKIHKQTEDALVSSGLFILESYNPKQLDYKTGGPASTDLLYTDDQIKSDFHAIDWVISQDTIRNISEGTGHLGMSSTLQMIGRRR